MMLTFYNSLPKYPLNLLYINSYDLLLFLLICFSFWSVISNCLFRKKFTYFMLLLLSLGGWGFYYSWDGWVCLLLLAELLVILLFLLVWISFKFTEEKLNILSKYKIIYLFLIFLIYGLYIPNSFLSPINYYTILYWTNHSILSSDFYVMFKFFFIDYLYTVFYITLLLSLISIFFICFYLSLKKIQNTTIKKKKTIHILRKQQMSKQALFKSQLRTFQAN